MTSTAGAPRLATGPNLTRLGPAQDVAFSPHPGNGVWMEAIVVDDEGTWYGYYHNENPAVGCGRPDRAVARIGSARSVDAGPQLGRPRRDSRSSDRLDCLRFTQSLCDWRRRRSERDAQCRKDGSVHLFQPIPAASLRTRRRSGSARVGKSRPAVRPRHGLDRRRLVAIALQPHVDDRRLWQHPPDLARVPVGTPLAPTTLAWHDGDGKVDAFWGPSVHWNESIEQYVMLLNRAKDESYSQAGIYVSFAPRLDDPRLWTMPQRLMSAERWYPQVIGLTTGSGTDKVAGATARLFLGGRSDWVINFSR